MPNPLRDRKGNLVGRGDRLVDAFGGIWSVISLGRDGKAHCMSPMGRRTQIDPTRFIKLSARKKYELPTAGERRKWFFRQMEWEG